MTWLKKHMKRIIFEGSDGPEGDGEDDRNL